MDHIMRFLKGCLIGIANAIPGVSGGTLAVITGIYDRLVAALGGFLHGGEGNWKKNTLFLAPIALGMAAGLLGFSHVLKWMYQYIPVQTSLFFAGLILGSIPFMVRLALSAGFRPWHVVPALLAAGGVVMLAFVDGGGDATTISITDPLQALWFAFSAMIGMGAMVIPGISGSFMLLLMGVYQTFIESVRSFNIPLLAVFGVGAIAGLLVITRLLTLLLARFRAPTFWTLLGLVAGSVVDLGVKAFVPEAMAISNALGIWNIPLMVLALATGAGAALLLSADKKEKATREPA